MYELKPVSKESLDSVLAKAERYRLLNEPLEAESICLDVLEVDPENQRALVMLLLSLTDQFDRRLGHALQRARALLPRLESEYDRLYYGGIINERRAKAQLQRGGPGCGHAAYEGFRQALELYEKATELRAPGNDDAILRWNTCARILNSNPELVPAAPSPAQMLE